MRLLGLMRPRVRDGDRGTADACGKQVGLQKAVPLLQQPLEEQADAKLIQIGETTINTRATQ